MPVQAQLVVQEGETTRALDVTDFGTDTTGAATEQSLAAQGAAIGTTSDASSGNTLIGLLKAAKASLASLAGVINGNAIRVEPAVGAAFQTDALTDTELRAEPVAVQGLSALDAETIEALGGVIGRLPSSYTVTGQDANGNPTTWVQDGLTYDATYDANGVMLTLTRAGVLTYEVTAQDANGNPTAFTQDGRGYVATYDANGVQLTLDEVS